jgi:hypothetical protein
MRDVVLEIQLAVSRDLLIVLMQARILSRAVPWPLLPFPKGRKRRETETECDCWR